MRFLPLLIILLAIDLYAFQAFKVITQNWSATTKNILTSIYWAIPLIAFITILIGAYTDLPVRSRSIFTFLRTFVIIAYFSKVLIIGVLLIDDLRRLLMVIYETFASPNRLDYGRSRFLSQLGILLGSIPFISLTYGIIRNPYRYKIFQKTVPIKDLPKNLEGLRIVQISDIHSGSFTLKEPVKAAIELINNQNADLVFFTGDLVNNVASEMDPFIDVFDKIQAKFGVFSVLGNHDYGDYVRWDSLEDKKANLSKLIDTHKKMGWDILLNENRLLEVNNEKIAVIGVENYSAQRRFSKYGDLPKAYRGSEEAQLKLLLSHDPSHWEYQVTKEFKDIDLTFSGHTHGMQFGIEIPGWIKWSPIKYVYKQWAGLYTQGNQHLYVNRGLGFLGYPGRVGILPEVTVIDLKKA